MSKKSTIINVSMPKEFSQKIDFWRAITVENRSEFIRSAVRRYINYLQRKNKDASSH